MKRLKESTVGIFSGEIKTEQALAKCGIPDIFTPTRAAGSIDEESKYGQTAFQLIPRFLMEADHNFLAA